MIPFVVFQSIACGVCTDMELRRSAAALDQGCLAIIQERRYICSSHVSMSHIHKIPPIDFHPAMVLKGWNISCSFIACAVDGMVIVVIRNTFIVFGKHYTLTSRALRPRVVYFCAICYSIRVSAGYHVYHAVYANLASQSRGGAGRQVSCRGVTPSVSQPVCSACANYHQVWKYRG